MCVYVCACACCVCLCVCVCVCCVCVHADHYLLCASICELLHPQQSIVRTNICTVQRLKPNIEDVVDKAIGLFWLVPEEIEGKGAIVI